MENDNNKIFVEERQRKIVDYVNKMKKVTVAQLSSIFNVSKSTIRNDLTTLDNMGTLKRTHGGALKLFSDQVSLEPLPKEKEKHMTFEKKSIAVAASNIVKDNDTIAITTGTTTLEFTKEISSKKRLTVVTNDIKIALYLENNSSHNVMLIGGLLRKSFHYTTFYEEILPRVNVDKIFFSCNGYDVQRGATIPDYNLASNIRSIIVKSNSVFLLCDSSKMEQIMFAQIAAPEEINAIITDNNISDDFLEQHRNFGHNKIIIGE